MTHVCVGGDVESEAAAGGEGGGALPRCGAPQTGMSQHRLPRTRSSTDGKSRAEGPLKTATFYSDIIFTAAAPVTSPLCSHPTVYFNPNFTSYFG